MDMHPETVELLDRCAADFQAANPDYLVYREAGTVWIRVGDKEYGIFSAIITGPQVVQCWDPETGMTPIHRSTREGAKA